MKTTETRNELNSRSGNNYSRSEINNAYHAAKSSGCNIEDAGVIEKFANDNRHYLSTPNEAPSANAYTGYANQESDF